MAEPREYLKLKYMGECKCGNCQLVPPEKLEQWAQERDMLIAQLRRLAIHACDELALALVDKLDPTDVGGSGNG